MNAEVVAIGDELLIGQVVNTNASWLGARLSDAGITLRQVTTVGDDREDIAREVRASMQRSDLVIVSGGLGPTHDDVTKEAVAGLFGAELEFHEDLFEALRARFERAGLKMSPSNRTQAEVPKGFRVLPNRWGSAPGLLREGDSLLVLMPGVPRELKGLVEEQLLPLVAHRTDLLAAERKTLLTTGIAESALHDRIGDLGDWVAAGCALAYLPSIHGVRMRLTATKSDPAAAGATLERFERFVRDKAGRHVYGEGEDLLEEVVGRLLMTRRWSVATAESCTGGLVASRFTDVPGSSRYVRGSVVAYSNDVKRSQLGVKASTLRTHGAVSREVVQEMAEGVRSALDADVGIATSGVMGPGGGTDEKPVGTVWMAVSTPDGERSLKLALRHDRVDNKARTATAALDLLRRVLEK